MGKLVIQFFDSCSLVALFCCLKQQYTTAETESYAEQWFIKLVGEENTNKGET